MLPRPGFASYGTGFESSTKSRVEPSASVSKPGIRASGESARWARGGARTVLRFGVDHPYPVAGTTTLSAPEAEAAGAPGSAAAEPAAVAVAAEPEPAAAEPDGGAELCVSAVLAAGSCANPPVGTSAISTSSAPARTMERIPR